MTQSAGHDRGRRTRPGNIVAGIVLLARGRRTGLDHFAATEQGFLASLAPLIAFPLVTSLLALVQGGGIAAVTDLLATFCALLAPPVISHALARAWGREAGWLRYATAFNWCQWAIPVIGTLAVLGMEALVAAGMPVQDAAALAAVVLGGYALWLHWFIARHGLALSRARAVLLVVLVNLGSAALLLGPTLIAVALARRA
jgi:hypothetical protein